VIALMGVPNLAQMTSRYAPDNKSILVVNKCALLTAPAVLHAIERLVACTF
jgi:hypothetical protein